MLAMRRNRLVDQSSIPFLITALRDPDRQGLIPDGAYVLIHELRPSLGPPKDRAYFRTHREEEITALEQWWANQSQPPKTGSDETGNGGGLSR